MPRRLEAKPLWIGGVFVLYTVCLWFRVSNMPFLKDDSQWIGITQQIVSGAIPWNQIFQSGVFSTGLVPHSYLTAFVFSLVYLVSPSVYSVALLCAASVLGTHAVLVQIGKEFGDWRTGLMASLLLFFCPLNYLYYSLRTWNLVFLPLGIVVFLLFVFRFHRKGQTRDLLLASAMLGVATNFHPTALVLLPLLWSTLAQRDLPFRVVVLAALSITVTLFPFLSWAVANGRYAIAGGLWGMIWVPMWALSRLSLSSVTYWRAVLGTLGLVVLWIGFPSTVFPRAAWPFVASPQWLQRNMDWAPFWMPLQWIVPLLWGLALCYLFKNRSHRSHRLLLVANLLGPLGLAAGGIVSGIHYSFYQLFFLPLFFVAVAVVLTDPRFLPVPILRCLGILAIGPYVLLSLGSEMRLTRNGGFGEYCATLGQRYRALTQILEMDSEANLVIPDKGTCSGSEPWQQMRTELGGMQGSGTPFYVLEPWGKGFHPSQLDWTYTDRPEFQVGSLVVFLL